jgi:CheY-like chemotaxis protein/HPt (histidine-containing phosphotransfer) domain-containing protein
MRDANAMKPRLLLVEDDPASRMFMAAIIAGLPADVDSADSVGAAFGLATTREYALWLIDARLPDGNGIDLLAKLRRQGRSTPALAHTASRDPDDHAALAAAGFLATLIKPFAAHALREAIASTLGDATAAAAPEATTPDRLLPLWDDDSALAAMNGNREHVAALRALFLAELPSQRSAALAALGQGDFGAARDTLHRLKASCGFVGALRLKSAVERLDAAPGDSARADEFSEIVDRTLVG